MNLELKYIGELFEIIQECITRHTLQSQEKQTYFITDASFKNSIRSLSAAWTLTVFTAQRCSLEPSEAYNLPS